MTSLLTPEQHGALWRYAHENGRRWKGKLWLAWEEASAGPVLQEMRSTHGADWLAHIKPQEEDGA